MEGIRRALVLGLVLIAGTAIEQALSVGSHKHKHTQGHQHTQHRTTTGQNTQGKIKQIIVTNTYFPPTDTTSGHFTLHRNNFLNIIQPHNLAYNTRTKIRSPSHNHNNQHTHQIQTTTKQTHSRTIGKQTGYNSLQTPRLLSLTFNHYQTYTLQTPSSQTSFSTQTNTTSQIARYTPHEYYFQNT